MADIGRYPIVETVKTTDQFLVYRTSDGQTVKIPFSAFQDAIATRFTQLIDTPSDYVGQVGKTLAVNSAEDALEFVPNNLSPTFQTLPDTPTYPGNALRRLRANAGETALEYADMSFTENTDVPSTYAGGKNRILTVNGTETGLKYASGIEIINQESDLPPVNGAGEHELAANISYWFANSLTLTNPIRFISQTTDVVGNGVFQTIVTYTGSGAAVRGDTGTAICLRNINITSSGDGIQFNGSGPLSGSDIIIDKCRILANTGYGLISNNPAQIILTDSLFLSATGLQFTGSNCGIFYADNVANLLTTAGVCLDFGSSVWVQLINILGMPFEGLPGATAISGLASNGNLAAAASARVQNCVVPSTLTPLSGITTADTQFRFDSNIGIADSNTVAMAYITTPATTNVTSGVDVPIAGTFTAQGNTERATVSASGEITFLNIEEEKGLVNLTFTANKIGGGTGIYIFKVQKSPLGSGFVDVEGVVKTVSLTSGVISSITLMGIAKYKDTDVFRVTVQGSGTSDDIDVDVTQFVIGS